MDFVALGSKQLVGIKQQTYLGIEACERFMGVYLPPWRLCGGPAWAEGLCAHECACVKMHMRVHGCVYT